MTANTVMPIVSSVSQTTPFTFAEITDIRRFAGYKAFSSLGYYYEGNMANLDIAIVNMSDQEQAVMRTVYLATLPGLESAVLTAGTNMGTDEAAVWKRNRTERQDRTALYNAKRRDMCGFIGVAPGPALGDGGGRVIRC